LDDFVGTIAQAAAMLLKVVSLAALAIAEINNLRIGGTGITGRE
jgi:hypothetical protein